MIILSPYMKTCCVKVCLNVLCGIQAYIVCCNTFSTPLYVFKLKLYNTVVCMYPIDAMCCIRLHTSSIRKLQETHRAYGVGAYTYQPILCRLIQ